MYLLEEIRRNPKKHDLRKMSTSELLEQLIICWEYECQQEVPDLDRLVLVGKMVRFLPRVDVESSIKAWLSEKAFSSQALDVSGIFLMSFWSGADQVDGELVNTLLMKLENNDITLHALEAVIASLCTAYPSLSRSGDNYAQRLTELSKKIINDPIKFPVQSFTSDRLRTILSSEKSRQS